MIKGINQIMESVIFYGKMGMRAIDMVEMESSCMANEKYWGQETNEEDEMMKCSG